MDGIIDTVSAPHPVAPLIDLLKTRGKLVVVGATGEPLTVPSIPMLVGKKPIILRMLLASSSCMLDVDLISVILQEERLWLAATLEV